LTCLFVSEVDENNNKQQTTKTTSNIKPNSDQMTVVLSFHFLPNKNKKRSSST